MKRKQKTSENDESNGDITSLIESALVYLHCLTVRRFWREDERRDDELLGAMTIYISPDAIEITDQKGRIIAKGAYGVAKELGKK